MRPSLPLYIGHLHMAQNDNNNLKRPTTIKTTQYLITIDIVLLFLKKSNDKTQQQQFKVGQVTMSSLHDTRSISAVNPAAIQLSTLMVMNRAIWTWRKNCMPILNSRINELYTIQLSIYYYKYCCYSWIVSGY